MPQSSIDPILAENLKTALSKSGKSAYAVVKSLGHAPNWLCRVINKESGILPPNLREVAKELGVSPGSLVDPPNTPAPINPNSAPSAKENSPMPVTEPVSVIEPTPFNSLQRAQALTDKLEEYLHDQALGAPNIRPELVEIFSELVNNAAEHGASDTGAHVYVRYLPHRKGQAFDLIVADQGPGIRATLAQNPSLPPQHTDQDAIGLAVQELVSGTSVPTRGIGLWMTATAMQAPGRNLRIYSGAGLLVQQGDAPPELRPNSYHQGTLLHLTIPV